MYISIATILKNRKAMICWNIWYVQKGKDKTYWSQRFSCAMVLVLV